MTARCSSSASYGQLVECVVRDFIPSWAHEIVNWLEISLNFRNVLVMLGFLLIRMPTYQWKWLVAKGLLSEWAASFCPLQLTCTHQLLSTVINYFRWKWQGSCTFTVQHFLHKPQPKEWWDVSVSKSISWNSGLSAVTHAQTATEMWLRYGREVSVIEWPPHILVEKNEVSEQKW